VIVVLVIERTFQSIAKTSKHQIPNPALLQVAGNNSVA
jgi:hypothetical protein